MVAVLLALAAAVGFGGSDYAAGLALRKTEVLRVAVAAEGLTPLLSYRWSSSLAAARRRC